MSKISVAFLFCLASTIANAQSFTVTRTLQCSKLVEVLKILPNYGENILWQGKDSKNMLSLLTLNASTQSWTLVLTDGESACVLNEGKGFVIPDTPNTNNQKQSNKNPNL